MMLWQYRVFCRNRLLAVEAACGAGNAGDGEEGRSRIIMKVH
jgi:hypothetical protein